MPSESTFPIGGCYKLCDVCKQILWQVDIVILILRMSRNQTIEGCWDTELKLGSGIPELKKRVMVYDVIKLS